MIFFSTDFAAYPFRLARFQRKGTAHPHVVEHWYGTGCPADERCEGGQCFGVLMPEGVQPVDVCTMSGYLCDLIIYDVIMSEYDHV